MPHEPNAHLLRTRDQALAHRLARTLAASLGEVVVVGRHDRRTFALRLQRGDVPQRDVNAIRAVAEGLAKLD